MYKVAPVGKAAGSTWLQGNPDDGDIINGEFFNLYNDEVDAVLEAAGIVPDETGVDRTQLAQAIQALIVAAVPSLAGYLRRDVPDILSAGFFTEKVPVAIAAGHAALDLDAGNVFTIAVGEPFTLDFPALEDLAGKAGMMIVIATQDGVGGHGLTLAAGYHLTAGSWDLTAGAVNQLWITSDGSGTDLDVVIAKRGA